LWEDRFKSVIVEDGWAARTMTAYIDLNPVRAGMVSDPADYRWSSYGEAVGAGATSAGNTARAGLVRALWAHQGATADAGMWRGNVAREYRRLLMAAAGNSQNDRGTAEKVGLPPSVRSADGNPERSIPVATVGAMREADEDPSGDEDLPYSRALRCRIRYFTDGAVIGSRRFVDEAFMSARWRFGRNRRDGARRLRGSATAMAGVLWSSRDLQKGIGTNMDVQTSPVPG
jgi:hypothetical protein